MKLTAVGVWGGYPKVNSATSAFLVEYNGFQLLFDCGSGVLAALQNYIPVQQLDAVIVSHYHHDHIADIGPLQYAKLIQNQLNGTENTLPIYAHNRDKSAFKQLTFQQHTKGFALEEDDCIKLGPFTVRTIKTNHPVFCLAIRLDAGGKSIAFTADTEWSDALIPFIKEADFLVCEANLYEGMEGNIPGHLSGRQAGMLAKRANVKKLILTHLPHFGDLHNLLAEAKTSFSGEVVLAEEGKVYEVTD
ncbi:Ribonuclease BN, tRNA processing enzyme [Gracilibacillus ureilyticus]|uniref:Ribonuclease BN, tRNA processing enzyme n=1 Tax=Gracilibacillus ureilyticus TaxID=531814 RepID=A0A1H9VKH0_9BACI|nr:MBL fold metallo-hydrolase [Gracilibacillus ureilyticus]SES21837.1 Ribonuclease BN, tRNA processing enzyme [Gracilibacillus ureilyticus]